MSETITSLSVIELLERRGARPAIITVEGEATREHSGAEIAERARRLALGLRAAGVEPGEPIGLYGANRPEWVIARLAVGAAGALAAPFDDLLPEEEVAPLIAYNRCQRVFTTREHLARLRGRLGDAEPRWILLDPDPAPHGTIRCHFAKPNPFGAALADDRELLLIFQGPQGYITPSWYPTKHQTGKVVPTWNYVAIHAYGRARTFDEPARLLTHLAALTDRLESPHHLPWKIDDAPRDFIDGLARGIVGVEIALTRIEGKWKMSQNRTEHDRRGVVNGLRARGDGNSLAMADLVEAAMGEAD